MASRAATSRSIVFCTSSIVFDRLPFLSSLSCSSRSDSMTHLSKSDLMTSGDNKQQERWPSRSSNNRKEKVANDVPRGREVRSEAQPQASDSRPPQQDPKGVIIIQTIPLSLFRIPRSFFLLCRQYWLDQIARKLSFSLSTIVFHVHSNARTMILFLLLRLSAHEHSFLCHREASRPS